MASSGNTPRLFFAGPVYLRTEPPDTLHFTKEGLTQSLKLTSTHSSRLAFKVKTTSPNDYIVRPNCGFLLPGDSVTVSVALQANYDIHKRHRFLVLAMETSTDAAERDAVWKDVCIGPQVQQHKMIVKLPSGITTLPTTRQSTAQEAAATALPTSSTLNCQHLRQLQEDVKVLKQKREELVEKLQQHRQPPSRTVHMNYLLLVLALLMIFLAVGQMGLLFVT